MAIHFKTGTPKKLLAAYKKAIDDGHIKTWTYDSDGDFTHSPEQWIRQAWMRPKIIEKTELIFYILTPVETKISSETYAVYHGRLIESFLNHCDTIFQQAVSSALPEQGDVVE